jgi:hypothetical protein
MPSDQHADNLGALDPPDDGYVSYPAASVGQVAIDEFRRALADDVAALTQGEQLSVRIGERSLIVERIGESVLVILDWPRLGRDLHELLDHVTATNDPAMQLFLFRGETFVACVRLQFDVDDIDRLWAVVHA